MPEEGSFQNVQWVVIAHLLAITTLIVSVGRLGDIIGWRRRKARISLFTLASIACGVSTTLPLLIAARAVQGLGAAVMMALRMTLQTENNTAVMTSILSRTPGRHFRHAQSIALSGVHHWPQPWGELFAFGAGTTYLTQVPLADVAAGMRNIEGSG